MIVIHILTTLYALATHLTASGDQPPFSSPTAAILALPPVSVAVFLAYVAILLGLLLVNNRTVARAVHFGLAVAVILAAGVLPSILVLLPLHVTAGIPDSDTRTRSVGLAIAGVAVVLGSIAFVRPPLELSVALWTAGVFAADATFRDLKLTAERSALRAEEAEAIAARLRASSESMARVRVQNQETARLEERNRIAVEIHDRVGHTITGSLLQLEAARIAVAHDPEEAGRRVEKVAVVLKEGMESIRSSLRAIKPETDRMGLARLEREVYEFDAATPISAGLRIEGASETIPAQIWEAINQNVTEALTNVARHSDATAVDVLVAVYARLIRLEVWDNGRGSAAPVRPGMGLRGIEERTALAGGVTTFDQSDGFRVVCVWRIAAHGD